MDPIRACGNKHVKTGGDDGIAFRMGGGWDRGAANACAIRLDSRSKMTVAENVAGAGLEGLAPAETVNQQSVELVSRCLAQ